MRRRTTVLATVTATVTAALVGAPGIAGSSAGARPVNKALARSHPAWTASARHLGHARDAGRVHMRVYLAPRGGFNALRRTAIAMSTPGSASYHHFLSHAAYVHRFGTPTATVDAVSAYLRSAGLTVANVGPANRFLSVRGTVRQAEKAFGTQLDRYSRNGKQVQAPASPLRVPTSLASAVLTVTGLDTSASRMQPANAPQDPPPAGFRNAPPCSHSYGAVRATTLPQFHGKTLPYVPCGYTGSQFRGAYEHNSALNGSGVTVAITDAYSAPTIRADITQYARRHGDGGYAPGQYVQSRASHYNDQALCDPAGWYGEQTLDVEAVHAMAPKANIHYYAGGNCEDSGLLDALGRVVDDDTAQLVTNSWGDVEATASPDVIAAYEQVFLQGAVEGISFMFSSGDNGDERLASGKVQADYPTSDPFVTSVGGTADAINANNRFQFQTGWGTRKYTLSSSGKSWQSAGFLYGAGGGSSKLFRKPVYQRGVAPGSTRQVPDVAMDADPNTGMLVGETQTFPAGVRYGEYRLGGTSLASPLFAGMTALALQHAGHGAGLLNPAIYMHRTAAFSDVRGTPPDAGNVRVDYTNTVNASDGLTYSLRTFDNDSSLHTNNGWDNVTGVGAANPGWLTALG